MNLTPRQAALLSFIRQSVEANGIFPSFQEMSDALGLNSKSGVHRLMAGLIERGYVDTTKGWARAYRLTNEIERFSTADLRAELARRGMDLAA